MAVLALVAVPGAPILAEGPLSAQVPPQRSVFIITVWEQSGRAVGRGSAFFVSSDGRAVTASHVVYRAHKDRRLRLLAIVGREFYGAAVTCASELPDDPRRLSRDVAEIRVTPADFSFDEITYNKIPYATAHRGSLPAFPALALGPDPSVGERVRVLGFGAAQQPLPYEWSAEGEVSRKVEFPDGTPGFTVVFAAKPAVPGHSGSPVLNSTGQVVGLWEGHDLHDAQLGIAVSSLALQPTCP
jgi:V8-like Glu-specific endopeptidase